MKYEEFKIEYKNLLSKMLSYETGQAGSRIYCEKLGELVDSVPVEWEDKADCEIAEEQAEKED